MTKHLFVVGSVGQILIVLIFVTEKPGKIKNYSHDRLVQNHIS